MLNTELEKNSAPNDFDIPYEDVDYVICDLDNTLLATREYYIDEYRRLALEHVIPQLYPEGLSKEEEENFVKEYINHSFLVYKRANRPLDITEQCGEGLRIYLEELGYDTTLPLFDEMIEDVIPFFANFYKKSPELYESTLENLHRLNMLGKKIGTHSHAQREWTDLKVDYIKQLYKEKYGKDIEILVATTDIEDQKNSDNWIRVTKEFGFDPSRTMVFGDSWSDDILASIEAGFSRRVWIHHWKGKL